MEIPLYDDICHKPKKIEEVHSGINWFELENRVQNELLRYLEEYRKKNIIFEWITLDIITRSDSNSSNSIDFDGNSSDYNDIKNFSFDVEYFINDILKKCHKYIIKIYKNINNFYAFDEYNECHNFLINYNITYDSIYENIKNNI